MKNLDLIKKLMELPVDADVSFLVRDESDTPALRAVSIEGVFPSTASDVLLASDEDDLLRYICDAYRKEVIKKRNKHLEDFPPGKRDSSIRYRSFSGLV